jgi:hypothetical protein
MGSHLLGAMSIDVTFPFAENAVSSPAFFLSKQGILGDNGRCFSNDRKLPCHHATSSCAPGIKPHVLNRKKRGNRKYSKPWKKCDNHKNEIGFISYFNVFLFQNGEEETIDLWNGRRLSSMVSPR